MINSEFLKNMVAPPPFETNRPIKKTFIWHGEFRFRYPLSAKFEGKRGICNEFFLRLSFMSKVFRRFAPIKKVEVSGVKPSGVFLLLLDFLCLRVSKNSHKTFDAFFCDLNIFFPGDLPPPPKKTPFYVPQKQVFFKKNFFKENFQIFCMNFL